MADSPLNSAQVQGDGQQHAQTGNVPINAAVSQINQDFKEKEVAEMAKKLGLEYVDILHQPVNPDVFDIMPFAAAKQAMVLPFSHIGNNVALAVANPQDPQVQELVQKLQTEKYLTVKLYLASPEGISRALEPFAQRFAEPKMDTAKLVQAESVPMGREEKLAVLQKLGQSLHQLGESMEGLQQLEQGALMASASDIHFQPEVSGAKVRFRIDGVLQLVTTLDPAIYQFFVTQIKHKSGMKINVTDVPQDGRYSFQAGEQKVDVRVSSLPTEFGDSLVLRLLDAKDKILDLVQLGYAEPALSLLEGAKELSQGMIMVTGPTGSGKSTTLYTLLKAMNTPERKVITLEDPVEYKMEGIVQSPIKADAGYTFDKGLEAILRQDPDVIMVGEIRDQITAETAAQAALTGHIVLCTLHTNNAIEAIPRFINMGVKPFIAAPALNIIVAQRLVRQLCDCKQPATISEKDQKFIDQVLATMPDLGTNQPTQLFAPGGCEKCSSTGFKGRLVIAEGFKVTEALEELILAQASLQAVRKQIIEEQKMRTMVQDGIIKVLQGLTTVDEVKRVAMF